MTNVNALKKVFIACGGSESDFSASTIVEGLKLIFTQLGGDPSALAGVDTTAAGIANLAEVIGPAANVVADEDFEVNSLTSKLTSWSYKISGVIKIPDNVVTIGSSAFEDNAGAMLTTDRCNDIEVVIPNSVRTIESGAFRNANALKSIVIPDGVQSIGNVVFDQCLSLSSIYIPKTVTTMGQDVFNLCNALTDIYYTGTEEQWSSITGLDQAGIPSSAAIHYNWTPTD